MTACSQMDRQCTTHGVPDLQLDLVAVDVDESCTELDSNGEVVYGLESLIGELEQQTTGIGQGSELVVGRQEGRQEGSMQGK